MNIRMATPDDAEAIAAIYAPIVLETTISFEWVPPTVDDFRARIAKTMTKYPWLVAADDAGAVAGFVYAGAHRDPPSYQWSVNTSVFIRADCRGRGVGKSLYQELHRQLANLDYYRAFAGVALPNEASVALHESVGYKPLASTSVSASSLASGAMSLGFTRTCEPRSQAIRSLRESLGSAPFAQSEVQ